jgi:hypothetical protein
VALPVTERGVAVAVALPVTEREPGAVGVAVCAPVLDVVGEAVGVRAGDALCSADAVPEAVEVRAGDALCSADAVPEAVEDAVQEAVGEGGAMKRTALQSDEYSRLVPPWKYSPPVPVLPPAPSGGGAHAEAAAT